jgi:glutathione S-transferase
MRLFYSPFHTFIHKVLVTAHEAGLWGEITFVATYPFKNSDGEDQGDAYSIGALNPLDKVPTLALSDGQIVFGSQAVVECLDGMNRSGTPLYPSAGPARWEAVSRLALADTLFETTVQMVMEGWHDEANQRIEFFEWIWPKTIRGLDHLEAYCKRGFGQFDIGQAAMLHALSYVDFRAKFYAAKDPLYPDYDAFEKRPNLRSWWDEMIQRPYVVTHYNVDFAGNDSAQFCQANVRAVIELQQANGTLLFSSISGRRQTATKRVSCSKKSASITSRSRWTFSPASNSNRRFSRSIQITESRRLSISMGLGARRTPFSNRVRFCSTSPKNRKTMADRND